MVQESEDRLGYCDMHLESALLSYGTWLAGQYGGDRGDCNPLEYWRCSRSDCDRCYEPYMFGYFNLARDLGHWIQAIPKQQERCGRHVQRPFMVIGKFERGRRFRCPLHGCTNVGPPVADDIPDVDSTEARPEHTTLTGNAKKEAVELSTFLEFAKAAYLPVESAENARPPRPDIRCLICGGEYWFELGRITDTNLAKAVSTGWPTDPIAFSFAQKEPLLKIIAKKAAAHYETNASPVDLVFHFDQQPPDQTALKRHVREHIDEIGGLCKQGPFSRVWIYDKWSKSVLWSSN
jgi:hypothetical protein